MPPVELPVEKALNIPVQKPQAQPATAGQKWAAVLVLAAIVGFYAYHISRKESSGAVRENSQRVFAQATGLHMQMTPAALRQARLLHETIVRNDPAWARGHSGLAHTYISMISTGGASRAEVAPLALGTAQRALELEPALEDAHSALVRYYRDVAFDLNRVEAVCRTALEKAAEPSQILVNCSAVESMRGNHEIAELWARDAVRSNPKWSESWAALAQALWRAGRAEAAQEPARKALAIDRNSIGARIVLAMTALSRKDIAGAAKAITDSLPANGIDREEWYSYRGAIAAASGDTETAEAMYNRLELRSHTMAVSPVAFARIRLAEADTEAALTLLEEGVRRRDVEAALLLTSPEARPLVGLPRYQAACRALGVPPL